MGNDMTGAGQEVVATLRARRKPLSRKAVWKVFMDFLCNPNWRCCEQSYS